MNTISFLLLRNRIRSIVFRAFGAKNYHSRWERSMRVLEEAMELAQSEFVSEDVARKLLERVYSRPVGIPRQEAAGLGVCWLAYTHLDDLDPTKLIMEEIHRVEEIDPLKFAAKQNEKYAVGLGLATEGELENK
jgi:hypothetical protein